MRQLALVCASLVIAVLASCGTHSEPCAPPTGCVRAEEVAGACQCLEWEYVSIEPAPMKYMVVGIEYSLLGNQTQVWYGHTYLGTFPQASSEFGTRWRSVIRAADGTEAVAALGPIDMGSTDGTWFLPLQPVTETSGALVLNHGGAVGLSNSWQDWDVYSHEQDIIYLWLNPGAAVTADRSGRRTVAWSSAADVNGTRPNVGMFLAGMFDGSIPPDPLLRSLDPEDMASILGHDPFFASTATDSATFASNPRFRFLGSAFVGEGSSVMPATGWSCNAPVTDGSFPILDTAEVPFGDGETLVLQSSTVGLDQACTVQTPGLSLGTSTPGCRFQADVFVDTVFGTFLTVPRSVDPTCIVEP